jgi:hypothetical protein
MSDGVGIKRTVGMVLSGSYRIPINEGFFHLDYGEV